MAVEWLRLSPCKIDTTQPSSGQQKTQPAKAYSNTPAKAQANSTTKSSKTLDETTERAKAPKEAKTHVQPEIKVPVPSKEPSKVLQLLSKLRRPKKRRNEKISKRDKSDNQ